MDRGDLVAYLSAHSLTPTAEPLLMKLSLLIAGIVLLSLSSCSVFDTGFQRQRYTDFSHRKHTNSVQQSTARATEENEIRCAEIVSHTDSLLSVPNQQVIPTPDVALIESDPVQANANETQELCAEKQPDLSAFTEEVNSAKADSQSNDPIVGIILTVLIVGIALFAIITSRNSRKAAQPATETSKPTLDADIVNLQLYTILNLICGLGILVSLFLSVVIFSDTLLLVSALLAIASIILAILALRARRRVRDNIGDKRTTENRRPYNFSVFSKVIALITFIGIGLLGALLLAARLFL